MLLLTILNFSLMSKMQQAAASSNSQNSDFSQNSFISPINIVDSNTERTLISVKINYTLLTQIQNTPPLNSAAASAQNPLDNQQIFSPKGTEQASYKGLSLNNGRLTCKDPFSGNIIISDNLSDQAHVQFNIEKIELLKAEHLLTVDGSTKRIDYELRIWHVVDSQNMNSKFQAEKAVISIMLDSNSYNENRFFEKMGISKNNQTSSGLFNLPQEGSSISYEFPDKFLYLPGFSVYSLPSLIGLIKSNREAYIYSGTDPGNSCGNGNSVLSQKVMWIVLKEVRSMTMNQKLFLDEIIKCPSGASETTPITNINQINPNKGTSMNEINNETKVKYSPNGIEP